MKADWREEIKKFFRGKILSDELLSRHTSFKIGGPADLYLLPADSKDLIRLIHFSKAQGIPRFIIGKGTNILVSNEGFRGIVIDLSETFNDIQMKECTVTAGAGVLLQDLLDFCARNNLGGLESLAGIPGALGGALKMNAGAFGGEIFDRLISIELLGEDGLFYKIQKETVDYGYRKGIAPGERVIVRAELQLYEADGEEIAQQMRDYLQRREVKQPLEYPSAGSIFKRPPGEYAGRLIDRAGCKGWREGDAQVSPKHANFIVNLGSARAKDVLRLMERVGKEVRQRFNVELLPEIELIGF